MRSARVSCALSSGVRPQNCRESGVRTQPPGAASATHPRGTYTARVSVTGIDHAGLTVADLERSLDVLRGAARPRGGGDRPRGGGGGGGGGRTSGARLRIADLQLPSGGGARADPVRGAGRAAGRPPATRRPAPRTSRSASPTCRRGCTRGLVAAGRRHRLLRRAGARSAPSAGWPARRCCTCATRTERDRADRTSALGVGARRAVNLEDVGSAPEDALRWARRLAAARDADGVLAALAEAVHDVLGMTVAVNLRRPADDRFEVTLVIGGGEEAAALVGEEYAAETFLVVCDPVHQRPDGIYLVPADSPYWSDFEGRVVVEQETVLDVPDAWRPGDMLDIALRDRRGEIMAVVAADDPADGRVPTPQKFGVVALLATHAASALEAALASSDAADGQREAEELQHLSLSLAAGLDEAEILTRASEGLASSCGWAFVAVGLFDHAKGLVRCVAGRRRGAPPARPDDAAPAGAGRDDREAPGGGLLPAAARLDRRDRRRSTSTARPTTARAPAAGAATRCSCRSPPAPARCSASSGSTTRSTGSCRRWRRCGGWSCSCGRRPCSCRARASSPTPASRPRAIPLTGLENGRAFEAAMAATEGTCSLALLDVDRFKLVNDRSGHLRGDALLRALADELTKRLPRAARAFRLGGDEFAVLSATMTPGGLARSLAAVRRGVDGVIDFSAGIAAAPDRRPDRRAADPRRGRGAACREARRPRPHRALPAHAPPPSRHPPTCRARSVAWRAATGPPARCWTRSSTASPRRSRRPAAATTPTTSAAT